MECFTAQASWRLQAPAQYNHQRIRQGLDTSPEAESERTLLRRPEIRLYNNKSY